MIGRRVFLLPLFVFYVHIGAAQTVLLHENFDDGDLKQNPAWKFHDEAESCFSVDGSHSISPPYSLRVSTNNQRASIQTFSGITEISRPFSIELNVYVEDMGDEAIPIFAKGSSLVFFLFLLPDGKVQFTVLKERTGWNPENLTIPQGYQVGRWHHFSILYDGKGVIALWIDGQQKGTVNQQLVDVPTSILIGNPSLPHTSTFFVDDLKITGERPVPSGRVGKIYLILCSDTGTWNGLNMFNKTNYFGYEIFSDPNRNAFKVMNSEFRSRFRDRLDEPLVMTWFMLVGSIMAWDQNPEILSPPVSNLEVMMKYHGDAAAMLNDEWAFHYHNWVWNDPDGDGRYIWNQSTQFEEYRDDFIQTIGHMIVDAGVLPTAFRSGWHYMDSQWEVLLDGLIPYRFENASPSVHFDDSQPLDNIYDWSRAPLEWIPYHPDSIDYQSKGSLKGWESRCMYMKSSLFEIFKIFSDAYQGRDQVVTLWSHLPEDDFPQQISDIDSVLHLASYYYPEVIWDYCTATEAMKKWRGTNDNSPPDIQYKLLPEQEIVKIEIQSSEPLWQKAPICFGKDAHAGLVPLEAFQSGYLTWEVAWNQALLDLRKVGIGATDTAGNATTICVDLTSSGISGASNPVPPQTFKLLPVYPNPASERVTILFYVNRGTEVSIEMINLQGRIVHKQSLFAPFSGIHSQLVNIDELSSGLYFARVQADDKIKVQKFVVRK